MKLKKIYLVTSILLILALIGGGGYRLYVSKKQSSMDLDDKITVDRESYSFELNNNEFIGAQNDQEMGDYQLTFYANIESFSGITIGKGAGEDCWKE